MAASIGSHFENIKCNILKTKNPIFMQFASNCAVFQILLDKILFYFCVPFPLSFFFAFVHYLWSFTENLVNYVAKKCHKSTRFVITFKSGLYNVTSVQHYICQSTHM